MTWTRRKVTRLVGAAMLLAGGRAAHAETTGQGAADPRASDHFDGARFFNPGSGGEPRGFADVLRWQLTETAEPWPDANPSPFADATPTQAKPDELRVSFVGHATFLVQIAGLAILTDPMWSERASPIPFAGPRRYNRPGIAFDDLPRIDAVLISHNHYDHLDLPTIERLWRRDHPKIVAPLGNEAIIREQISDVTVTSVDWDDTVMIGSSGGRSVSVMAEPVHHWSARGLGDRNRALWSGYTLAAAGRTLFFAGDTGYADGRPFRRVAKRRKRIDLALLPIGAYEPRWFMRAQHMNPDDAVQAFQQLRARQALGYHWGTFRLTNEGSERPARDLAAALRARNVPAERFLAVRPGQVWTA